MSTIKFSDNPNEETAFVETDDGQRNRAVLTAAVDGEIEFPANPNSTKVSVTVDGVKRKAVAVATIAGSGGGGGGDKHNLGYYATQAALEEAHPTAEAGDWAIVGATDTVWIWDTDNSEWVDSDQKGQVTSVNGQTGAVSLTIPDAVQYSTMPTAGADNLGDIVQFTGTTDANYTNGYFYKCVSDGQEPATYSWTRVDVQPSSGGATYTAGNGISIDANNEISVADPVLVNTATGNSALSVGGTATGLSGVSYGKGAYSQSVGSIAIGRNTGATQVASVAIGNAAGAVAARAIQLGSATNSDADTFKVANANGNFEIMSADGTIPVDRLTHAINKYSTMPTASASNLGWIVQFTGTTDSTYTHGHLYECVSDGADPATYSWSEVQLGGGSSYTAGTGIDITSGVISVITPVIESGGALVAGTGFNGGGSLTRTTRFGKGAYCSDDGVAFGNSARSNSDWATALGNSAYANSNKSVAVGATSKATGNNSVALGYGAETNAVGAIQINSKGNTQTNSDANTFKVANANGNFEIMSANGTIPAARHASLPATDGTYVLKLVIASGVPTLSWVAE